jgi:hypothetical protein
VRRARCRTQGAGSLIQAGPQQSQQQAKRLLLLLPLLLLLLAATLDPAWLRSCWLALRRRARWLAMAGRLAVVVGRRWLGGRWRGGRWLGGSRWLARVPHAGRAAAWLLPEAAMVMGCCALVVSVLSTLAAAPAPPLRPHPPYRGWAFGTNLTNRTLYPPGTINFVPTGPPVKSHGPPCSAACFAEQGVALLGWSYFWYPASPAQKANRSAWVDAYKQQLNPLRHGDQLPGLDMEAGVGMDECAGTQNATVLAIATEGWRAARRAWPANFVGAWWAGGCPEDMFISLMLDGTFDLAMIEGYAYCPGCGDWPASGDCCANSGVATDNKTMTQQAYYHKLDIAKEHAFLNRTIFCLGWVIGKSERNPGGWTVAALREALVDLKTKYPEMPGVIMYGPADGNATCGKDPTKHTCAAKDPATLALTLEANKMMRAFWPDQPPRPGPTTPPSSASAGNNLTCDVTAFGAVGDNQTDNTAAIQHAIHSCTFKGAATVLPAGGVYLSGPLVLPSHCTLELEPGATLIASPDYHSWPNDTHNNWCQTTPYEAKRPVYVPQLANFLYTHDADNVTVTGGGTIDGQGWRWWPLRKLPGDYWHNCRPKLLAAWNVSRLRVHNVTLRNSPMYVISAHSVRNARFTHVTIDSNPGYGYAGAPNTDGFNIQGENIYIGQSSVTNGDDCVPIGPPSHNVLVEDLVCQRGNGVVPIIWSNPGTIEDVVFRRVALHSTELAITVKSLPSFRGTVRNVTYAGITAHNVTLSAILFDFFAQNTLRSSELLSQWNRRVRWKHGPQATLTSGDAAVDARAPQLMRLSDVKVRDVRVYGAGRAGKLFCGNGSSACTALQFVNVSIVGAAAGWSCAGEVHGVSDGCNPAPCITPMSSSA